MMDDTRDRVIRLESEIEHITTQLNDMQAKGMRWLIIGMAAMAGFFASFAAKYLPFVK
jgi:hypothetical protein